MGVKQAWAPRETADGVGANVQLSETIKMQELRKQKIVFQDS